MKAIRTDASDSEPSGDPLVDGAASSRTDGAIRAAPLETTARLLELVRSGDHEARERLVVRCLPALRRWAHGRLPSRARGMVDTDDLVQVSLLRALNQVESFVPRREGAFLAYLRRTLLNSIRDELRRTVRRPGEEELTDAIVDDAPSLVEEAIGHELVERYEAALATLEEMQQEAVILRVEFGYTYQEIADAIGAPSGRRHDDVCASVASVKRFGSIDLADGGDLPRLARGP